MTHTLVASATRTHIIGFDRPFTVIGERINPLFSEVVLFLFILAFRPYVCIFYCIFHKRAHYASSVVERGDDSRHRSRGFSGLCENGDFLL